MRDIPTVSRFQWALVSSALGLQDLGLLLQVSLGGWGWFWKDELGQPLIADR